MFLKIRVRCRLQSPSFNKSINKSINRILRKKWSLRKKSEWWKNDFAIPIKVIKIFSDQKFFRKKFAYKIYFKWWYGNRISMRRTIDNRKTFEWQSKSEANDTSSSRYILRWYRNHTMQKWWSLGNFWCDSLQFYRNLFIFLHF